MQMSTQELVRKKENLRGWESDRLRALPLLGQQALTDRKTD